MNEQTVCVACGKAIARRRGKWSHLEDPRHLARPAEPVAVPSEATEWVGNPIWGWVRGLAK